MLLLMYNSDGSLSNIGIDGDHQMTGKRINRFWSVMETHKVFFLLLYGTKMHMFLSKLNQSTINFNCKHIVLLWTIKP